MNTLVVMKNFLLGRVSQKPSNTKIKNVQNIITKE